MRRGYRNRRGERSRLLYSVIPAHAGIQVGEVISVALDTRFRGHDEVGRGC